MADKIKQTFLSSDGTKDNIVYPITDTNAVYAEDGSNLTDNLKYNYSKFYTNLDINLEPTPQKFFNFKINNDFCYITGLDWNKQDEILNYFSDANTNGSNHTLIIPYKYITEDGKTYLVKSIGNPSSTYSDAKNFLRRQSNDNQLSEQITTLIIPNTIQSIYHNAFANCTKLQKVILSNQISQLFSGIFYNCSSLEEIYIPEGIREISGTFENCSGLEEIILPKTVYSLGESSFKNCSKLKKITIYNNKIQIINSATGDPFNGSTLLNTFYWPNATKENDVNILKNKSSYEYKYSQLLNKDTTHYFGFHGGQSEQISLDSPNFRGTPTINGSNILTESTFGNITTNSSGTSINPTSGNILQYNNSEILTRESLTKDGLIFKNEGNNKTLGFRKNADQNSAISPILTLDNLNTNLQTMGATPVIFSTTPKVQDSSSNASTALATISDIQTKINNTLTDNNYASMTELTQNYVTKAMLLANYYPQIVSYQGNGRAYKQAIFTNENNDELSFVLLFTKNSNTNSNFAFQTICTSSTVIYPVAKVYNDVYCVGYIKDNNFFIGSFNRNFQEINDTNAISIVNDSSSYFMAIGIFKKTYVS